MFKSVAKLLRLSQIIAVVAQVKLEFVPKVSQGFI